MTDLPTELRVEDLSDEQREGVEAIQSQCFQLSASQITDFLTKLLKNEIDRLFPEDASASTSQALPWRTFYHEWIDSQRQMDSAVAATEAHLEQDLGLTRKRQASTQLTPVEQQRLNSTEAQFINILPPNRTRESTVEDISSEVGPARRNLLPDWDKEIQAERESNLSPYLHAIKRKRAFVRENMRKGRNYKAHLDAEPGRFAAFAPPLREAIAGDAFVPLPALLTPEKEWENTAPVHDEIATWGAFDRALQM